MKSIPDRDPLQRNEEQPDLPFEPPLQPLSVSWRNVEYDPEDDDC